MVNKGLAKTEGEKTIKEHTEDLLRQYEIIKSIYPNIMQSEEWDLLKEAVIHHDLGKINSKFQNKLYKKLKYMEKELLEQIDERDEIPHNFLSPLLMDTALYERKYGLEKTKILLSSVYYHHDREEKQIQKEDIEDLIKQANYLGIEKTIKMYSRKYILKSDKEIDIEILKSKPYILIKGFLNKLDYVASLDEKGVNIEEIPEENGMTISDKIKEITKEKFNNSYREVQKYMMKNEEENLVVISYTGSGKTEAALLWAGKQKTFYTLPLKVSINAMEQRITKNIGYNKALLLHSDVHSYYENDLNKYHRAKRMCSPLIITTIDQLFKIAFRYTGYEEILATLSYSKIVIDEIQMYSPELLAYILIGLSMITQMEGKFAIITATFPPLLYSIMDYLKIPYKKQEESFKPHIMQRHKIELLKSNKFNYEEIRKLGKENKVLIIVNTIKRAQEIYNIMKDSNVHLLHSHYIKEDRKVLEDYILEFGDKEKNEQNGIWISTQIVEASLDIDFDILFTEMCSIDSLFQRMGRVYRKRLYNNEKPNVYILNNRNGVPYIIDSDIYEYTLKEIKKYNKNHGNEYLKEDIKQNMIENIFDLNKNKKLKDSDYYKNIKYIIKLLKDIRPNSIQKQEVNEKFRNIQNISLIPDNIYEYLDNKGKIEKWKDILNSKTSSIREKIKVKEDIANYTINVRWHQKLIKDKEELFYKKSNIYRTSYIYDFNKETKQGNGLIMKDMQNIGYFDE